MVPDDVYLNRLGAIIVELEAWMHEHRDVAEIETLASSHYWKLSVQPYVTGACPFALLLRSDQRFDLLIGGEIYEDKPIDRFEFFPMLARAIASGNVERVEVLSALTQALEAIEFRVTLEDGWAWVGERRVGMRGARRTETAQELRSRRYLPYRRQA